MGFWFPIVILVIVLLVAPFVGFPLRAAFIILGILALPFVLFWDFMVMWGLADAPCRPTDNMCTIQGWLAIAFPWIVPVGLWIAAAYAGKRK